MKPYLLLCLVPCSLAFIPARASHIVGGEFTYTFLGDTIVSDVPLHKYQVNLSIYEDCRNGQPEAIAEDNPAFLTLYDAGNVSAPLNVDTSVYYVSSVNLPPNLNNLCATNIPAVCLYKKTFVKTYYLPPNAGGYIVAYQRCCRNSAVGNIVDPADNGSTYYCSIPGSQNTNNSAIFKNYPPQIICLNNPLNYDHSATDADGDSLSYSFCSGLQGADASNIKPDTAGAPPYQNTTYIAPYSGTNPISGSPAITIDPRTGRITGTPNRVGRYLVTVCCSEWRRGVLINTSRREFQFVVTDCSRTVIADMPQYSAEPNTYIINCNNYNVHFVNTSKGGTAYRWDFGVAGSANDTSTLFEPAFTYPDTGIFAVKLIVNPGAMCTDSISKLVKIYPGFTTGFNHTGNQCPGSSLYFKDASFSRLQPVSSWQWQFGDGAVSAEQNPVHAYQYSGAYDVILVSQSANGCSDTFANNLVIDDFQPFAGHDTTIVRGESFRFDAGGGIKYLWSPSTFLADTNIRDPLAYFPDTGLFTYHVLIESPYGCAGYDTIHVLVVNQAAFFVPSAFTPNGDGLNDHFHPVAIGYRSLDYFRVLSRWGEEVYRGTDMDAGWDGSYKNQKAETGVYYWELKYTDRFGKKGFMKGDVTLLR